MRLTILSFVFIVLYHVSVAQVSIANNNVQSNNNCPLMEVNLYSNDNGIVEVSYCNHGNTTAIGAYVEIEVTNDLLITQATIPVSSVVGKKYTFHLGDVNSLECTAFYIEIPNAENKIHCTNVRIYPDDPCQAMIDQYIINSNNDTLDDDDDAGNDDDNNGINTTVAFSSNMQYSTPGTPLLGQGGTNSVYEDHVFLNNIPTWDSLLLVLTNSNILPNITTPNTSSTTSVVSSLDDIPALVSAELCSSNGGTTVIARDQAVTTSVDNRTIFGATTDNNDQAPSNTITTETSNYLEEYQAVVVRLYPNPFSTTATITIDGANYQQSRLEILDLAGKTIQSLQVDKQQNITLHRENLSQGVYFYRLIGDNTVVHTGKFVVR